VIEHADNPNNAALSDADVDSASNTAYGRKRMAAAAGKTANWLFVIIAVLLILLAILLIIVRLGAPWLGNYKGEIETRLSEQMGSPVVIDDLSVRWEQFGPKLSATGVSLNESDSRHVTLDEVLIELNTLKSISQATLVIEELTLVGAKLALETSSDGRFELHGVKQRETVTPAENQGVNMLSWLMDTSRVDLQDAQITLINADNKEQLTVTDLNVAAVNDDSFHQLRVDMQLPDSLGDRLELELDLTGNSDDIRNAYIDIHAKATDLKIDAWRSLQAERFKGLRLSTTGIARLDATTQIELWGTMSGGKLHSARGQILATDLVNINSQQRVIDRVSTDIVFKDMPSGWQLSTDLMEIQNGTELTSVHDVAYQFKPAENTAWKLDARGDSLKLDVATKLVLSLFDKDTDLPRAQWLAQAQPKGDLANWDASFALVNGKPDLSLFSEFQKLELNSVNGMPGVHNLGGTLDVLHNVGKIDMQGVDMALDIPAAYTQPLQLQKLDGQLDIDFQDQQNTLLKGDIVVDDFGFNGETQVEVILKSGESPHVYALGQFSVDDVSRVSRYVPDRLIKRRTYDWIDTALVAGQATNGELMMFGKVADFPFTKNEGVFNIGFDFNNASLNYLPGWPQATDMHGRYDVEGASIRITADDGVLDSMRFSRVDARIDSLFKPVLELNSTSDGSLAKLVDFGNTGPLKNILGPALVDVTADGQAQMDLNIRVPLTDEANITPGTSSPGQANNSTLISGLEVKGSVFLNDNAISDARAKLDLEQVRGAIGFTTNGIRVNNLQSLMHGRPVRIDAKTTGQEQQRTVEITMAGPMRASNIMADYDIPLTQFVDGESQWNVNVQIPMSAAQIDQRGIKIAAVSSLVGTHLQLPEPLKKPSGRAAKIALSSTIMPDSDRLEWLIDYNDIMRSIVRVDGATLQSVSARFGGGAANPSVKDGIRLDGNVEKLGLDAWVSSIDTLLDELEPSETPEPILPVSANLRVNKFIAGRQFVGGGTLRFNTESDYINGVISSQWLRGSVRYPRAHWKQDLPAIVRIASVDKRFVDALDSAPEGEEGDDLDPRILPPVEARISQVSWDQLDLKDLTIRTSPSVNGLNIDTFGFAYETAQLVGEGYWHLRDPQGVNNTLTNQHITKLNLTLQGYDFGALLSHIGFDGTLSEGEGVLSGSLVWPAAGYKPSLENLVGELDIDLNNGRILKVEPGAARLVGLFAVQSLPRRLSLDFKDLVLDGLDFETIRGRMQMANGIAHAPLVQMNGSIGVLDIAGESNLITEQYNQRITVLPRVSAALPIIGVISGGASAGLSVLFAGGVLKAFGIDFDRIGLREYTLTGSWDEPKLTQVPFNLPE